MSQPKSNEETVEDFKQLCKHNGVIGTTRISLSVFLLHALAQKDKEVATRFKELCTVNDNGDCKYFRDDIHERLLRGDKFVAQEILEALTLKE